MQKSVFETFIKRYSLGGICETAHWYSDAEKQTLTALAHTETKTVILKVVMKDWIGVESCKLALPSSSKVKAMLGPIGDDIKIVLNKIRDRVANFTVSDNDCEAICTVAEYDAFPETRDLDTESDNLPTDFEVEIQLTDEFVGKMMRAAAALTEAKDFVLINNKKGGLDMVINYEDTNTNRIRLPVVTTPGKDRLDTPMAYSTAVFKAIVSSNEVDRKPAPKKADVDATAVQPPPPPPPILRVSNRGIAILSFEDTQFKSTYFMFPTRLIE